MSDLNLSIAIATFNGMPFLLEQLASIEGQTRHPDEVIACDDASTDGTLTALERFRSGAPFDVTIVRNAERLGPTRNFEKAAELCSGDVVILCDQDDVWLPSKLSTVERLFEDNPRAAIILNDALLTDGELRDSSYTQLQNIRNAGLCDSLFITGCCSAHRKEWQRLAFPIPDGVGAHDLWINGLAHELGCARIENAVLQLYRRHDDNLSQWALSDPKGVSMGRALLQHGLQNATDGWQQELRLLDQMVERVETRMNVAVGLLGRVTVDERLQKLKTKRDAAAQRIRICAMSRWKRAAEVACFWSAGGYRSMSGWKSAIKDLVRP